LAVGAHRYRWFYVGTFVEPETGESLSLLVDGVDTEVMGWVLRELRAWLGEGEEAWVVLDRAGWHVSGRVEVPEGVRLVFLPPYSPELQPVERVWPLVNEAVANRYFHDLEEMMEVVAERCRVLAQDPETLRRHTLFHWWPRTRALSIKGYHMCPSGFTPPPAYARPPGWTPSWWGTLWAWWSWATPG
jgi:transposase